MMSPQCLTSTTLRRPISTAWSMTVPYSTVSPLKLISMKILSLSVLNVRTFLRCPLRTACVTQRIAWTRLRR